ncbi:MAG: helix-turn-helix domain-containing protein [Candidatus Thiodiazotropha sp.]
MLQDEKKIVNTVVLGLPVAATSVIFGILDVLASVGRDWEMVHGMPSQDPRFHPRLLSLDGADYTDQNGRLVRPDGALQDVEQPDLVIIPELLINPRVPLPATLDAYADWIKRAYQAGAMITSVCSGALLLAHSGLLDGANATTHWAYYDSMQQFYPKVNLQRERILVPAGDEHRIVTSGGASAWTDLLLYLIGRIAGADETRHIARLYLFQPHEEGQLQFASLLVNRQHQDKLVAEAQLWAANNYPLPNPVSVMVANSGLSERSFLRRFRRATGQSPVEYVQTLRIEEAKQMLEASDLGIDEIAEQVGYVEGSSFRRLFRKHVGITASVYRRKMSKIPGNGSSELV